MKIPQKAIQKIEDAAAKLQHGVVTLRIHIRDGHPRYKWGLIEWINDSDEPSTRTSAAIGEPRQVKRTVVVRKPRDIKRYYIPFAT